MGARAGGRRAAAAHLRDFVRSLGHAGRAVDLGCGDGRLTVELDADELTAADVSRVALERARGRTRRSARPAAASRDFVELEPDAPRPLGDGEFDLVLCAETIEHVARRPAAPLGGAARARPPAARSP